MSIKGFEEHTKPLSEKEKRILPSLIEMLKGRIGPGQNITNHRLARDLNYRFPADIRPTDHARVRKMIAHIRTNGTIPYLIANGRGYYIAESDEALRDYITSLVQRADAIQRIAGHLQDQLHQRVFNLPSSVISSAE
jgi:hypothetical protein